MEEWGFERSRGFECKQESERSRGLERKQGLEQGFERELEGLGIAPACAVYRNLCPSALVEHALRKREGRLSRTGAFVVETGARTGRSAKDKFIVDSPEVHDEIAWGAVNRPVSPEVFDALYARVAAYLAQRELFVFDGFAGAERAFAKRFRIVNELASQNLFIRQLLLRPSDEELEQFAPDYVILAAPGFICVPERDGTRSDAAVMIDYARRRVLIAGTRYAGEIKKAVFSVMNYVLPREGVLPMHCSANVGADGTSAVFFGLSGTGKTTLSADPARRLVGDDEHGWSDDAVFNFEGGCYAKCINLSAEHEPDIFNAIRFGALAENVVMDPDTRELDFDDDALAVNTRAGYPVGHIANSEPRGMAPAPRTVIFLTADAFGVLPPIAKLTLDQAMYYFLSGFTSKLAGTEVGVSEPVPTFSTCFGEPFLPLDPLRYALMLKERVQKAGARVYLINTGWNGTGERMPLKYTRAMVSAALDGLLEDGAFAPDPHFGVLVPTACPGVPDELLTPANTWADQEAYEASAAKLARMFEENFRQKYAHAPEEIRAAGPRG
ncbi:MULTISPECIES: phosphoenolpyruvate carboxykinase (ATP) [unclassified Adlercreutzia]|uniref:phosphoenolpyruvate carboxykinase (ATP) n=1 Tax=unclassified Adlercreutzia TaxID=2636013 RepID=UPI0013EC4371|nr:MULTISPECIES: phosphoenolpyruvate carboxykinase (ATP) [unclassified Adlercreutzia]